MKKRKSRTDSLAADGSFRIVISIVFGMSLAIAGCGDDDVGSNPDAAIADSGLQVDGSDIDASPAASPDAGVGVECGPNACDPGSQKCCVTPDPGGGIPTESCVATADPCPGADVTCDGPEDCTSPEICCGTVAQGGSSTCGTVDSCGGAHLVLCQEDADCPQDTPNCCANVVFGAKSCGEAVCAP
jgi:hypothetical protein